MVKTTDWCGKVVKTEKCSISMIKVNISIAICQYLGGKNKYEGATLDTMITSAAIKLPASQKSLFWLV